MIYLSHVSISGFLQNQKVKVVCDLELLVWSYDDSYGQFKSLLRQIE